MPVPTVAFAAPCLGSVPSGGAPLSERPQVRDERVDVVVGQARGDPVPVLAAAVRVGEPVVQRGGTAVVHERRAGAEQGRDLEDHPQHADLLEQRSGWRSRRWW
jgi:hypothetical protein